MHYMSQVKKEARRFSLHKMRKQSASIPEDVHFSVDEREENELDLAHTVIWLIWYYLLARPSTDAWR